MGSTRCTLRTLRSPDEGTKSVQDVAMVLGILELVAYILTYAKINGLTGPNDLLPRV